MPPKASGLNQRIADLSRVIRENPTDPAARESRAVAWFRRGDFDYAMEDMDEAVRLDPTNAHRYLMRALMWLEQRDFDRALADCKEAIRIDPQNGVAYRHAFAKRSGAGRGARELGSDNDLDFCAAAGA